MLSIAWGSGSKLNRKTGLKQTCKALSFKKEKQALKKLRKPVYKNQVLYSTTTNEWSDPVYIGSGKFFSDPQN